MFRNFALVAILFCTLISISHSQPNKPQYLRLPDGTHIQIKEGESADQAWFQAMRKYPEAFGLVVIPDNKKMDLDWFNTCRATGVKDAKTNAAISQMVAACKHKAVPKKCRVFDLKTDSLGNEVGEERIKCVAQCISANAISKSIGECSKG
jgi:hypothetical protein